MRILLANDGVGDAGGVQAYLACVIPALAARGHHVALLHLDRRRAGDPSPAGDDAPHFCMQELGIGGGVDAALAWGPDVAFSHNMRPLEVDRRLAAAVPVAKMMHGYFGTCVSGQKAHLFPSPVPCGRRLGPACLALYGPRRCGRLSVGAALGGYAWAREQNALFAAYAAFVVASAHMRAEYVRNGAPPERVHALPLFPTFDAADEARPPAPSTASGEGDGAILGGPAADATPSILFLGRMTPLKGGDLLIRAVGEMQRRHRIAARLVMAGDGPRRGAWEALARELGVRAEFTGWVEGDARDALIRGATLLAVPSVWPEPFGLVGLEAGTAGVPAIAFDVGGVGEWLADGVNGRLVPGSPHADTLADALAELLRAPHLLARMRAGAREAAHRLSLARHVDALERVLMDAAATPAPVPAAALAPGGS